MERLELVSISMLFQFIEIQLSRCQFHCSCSSILIEIMLYTATSSLSSLKALMSMYSSSPTSYIGR